MEFAPAGPSKAQVEFQGEARMRFPAIRFHKGSALCAESLFCLVSPVTVIEVPPRKWSAVKGVSRTHDATIAVAVIGRGVTGAVVGRAVAAPGIRIVAVAVTAVIGRCVAAIVAVVVTVAWAIGVR